MRALFLFLRVVASLISMSLVGLGVLYAVLAVWLICEMPRTGAGVGGLAGMAGFGLVMTYFGARVLREQGRMFVSWWRTVRQERGLPQARLVLR
jgi:hypothetical protein